MHPSELICCLQVPPFSSKNQAVKQEDSDEIEPASCSTADVMAVYHSHYLTESIKEAGSCLRSSPGARWEQLGGQWRNVIYRDQRSLVLIWCSKFQPGSGRLAAGWCRAHMMAMNLWNRTSFFRKWEISTSVSQKQCRTCSNKDCWGMIASSFF